MPIKRIEKIKKNIPKVYLLNFFMMFLVTIPIIVPYWNSYGITIKEVYSLQALFGLMMIILDVPAGYISDLFGRKVCLIIVGIFNIITYTILALGTKYFHFALFEISAAITMALYSGCDIALIYDSIDEINENDKFLIDKKKDHESKLYLGRRIFYSQTGEAIGSLLGGLFAIYSLTLPSKVNVLTSIVPFFIALTLVEPKRKMLESKNHLSNFKFIFKNLFFKSKYLTMLIIFSITFNFSTFAVVWAYQTYWKAIGIGINYYGVLWALFNFSVAMIAKNALKIEKKMNNNVIMILVALLPPFAYIFMGKTYNFWGTIIIFLFAISRALNGVLFQDGINKNVPANMRATTNSFCSLGMRAIFFFFGPWFGVLIDEKGVHYALLNSGYMFLALALVILMPMLYLSKTQGSH